MNRHPAVDWRATLRLQLHAGFTLDDAREQVPYFARLGISHLYASPLLTAREGSMHGYDVVDPTRVSPARPASRSSHMPRKSPAGMSACRTTLCARPTSEPRG